MHKSKMGSSGEVKFTQTVNDFGIQAQGRYKTQEFLAKLTGLAGIYGLTICKSWEINQETNLYPVSVLQHFVIQCTLRPVNIHFP